jgi:hypothetical protein
VEAFSPKQRIGWARLNITWEHRTRLASELLKSERSVVDVGCGLMALRALLPSTTRYIPVDIVPRGTDTILVDLNKEAMPPVEADAAALLGVIEYIIDPRAVLLQFKQFRTLCVSYNYKGIKDVLWTLFPERKKVGWKNRLTKRQFERLVVSLGYRILLSKRVRVGERIYLLRSM